jgi:peptide/nickel transport system permease protein
MAQEQAILGVTAVEEEEKAIYVAGPWLLMWWRFKKHKMAMASVVVIALFYLVAIFADFLSSDRPAPADERYNYAPPQTIHWFDRGWIRPYVLDITSSFDLETFKKSYDVDPEVKLPVRFFGHGYEYKFLGLFKTDRHLLVVEARDGPRAPYIIGADAFGRDLLSRIFHGTRISLTIGLVGVSISIVLGVTLGGLSGFYGGFIDTIVQRMIEILRSIPTIPLWLGLAASLPRDWSITRIYLAITVILSLYAWTELARVVRGRFLAMREEDFTMAAKLAGASDTRIIFRHMVPNFTSHLIATATLAVPFMIISETALSFLGLGLVPPAISWGVLLKSTQNVQSVALYPWLMLIALPVIVAVLAFNFIGDGLRDAADPYA